ncbi:hypothetical protein [Helicobacter sp. 23-1045]
MKRSLYFLTLWAVVAVQGVADLGDLSVDKIQDFGVNQSQDLNKISRESNADSSNSAFAPPKSDFCESHKLIQIAIQMPNPRQIHTPIRKIRTNRTMTTKS